MAECEEGIDVEQPIGRESRRVGAADEIEQNIGASDIDVRAGLELQSAFLKSAVSIRADVKNDLAASLRVGAGGDPQLVARRVADLQGAPVEGNGIRHHGTRAAERAALDIDRRWVQGATIEICHGGRGKLRIVANDGHNGARPIDRHGAGIVRVARD